MKIRIIILKSCMTIHFDNNLRFKEDDKLLDFFKEINFIDYEVISITKINGLL